MTRLIVWLIAALAALSTVGVALAVDPTPTATPAAKLAFGKVATGEQPIGGIIGFTITVTNSGNADSTSQTVFDTLPGGIDWWIAADTWGCTLAPSVTPGRTVLRCGPAIAEKRQLNNAEDDFVNGSLSVTVFGQAYQCGSYFNVAVFNGLIASNPAIAYVTCPVTPTPVPPTATPTSAPTQTPQPTATPQPTQTATPTVAEPFRPSPTVRAPLPPRTGDSPPLEGDSWPWKGAAFIVLAITAIAGVVLGRYRQ